VRGVATANFFDDIGRSDSGVRHRHGRADRSITTEALYTFTCVPTSDAEINASAIRDFLARQNLALPLEQLSAPTVE